MLAANCRILPVKPHSLNARRKLQTGNMEEFQNKELKKRTQCIKVSSSKESLRRIATELLTKLNENWKTLHGIVMHLSYFINKHYWGLWVVVCYIVFSLLTLGLVISIYGENYFCIKEGGGGYRYKPLCQPSFH